MTNAYARMKRTHLEPSGSIPEDSDAFERMLADGLRRYPCRMLAYQLLPNQWHVVLQLQTVK